MRPGDLLEQRYRLVRVLGRGRSGSVWCARNELIDRAVAIKILHRSLATDPERLQRFFQEARACGRVRHPAVVEVLDLGQADDGVLFLVMELLEGETLSSLLARKGRLGVDEALSIIIPLARGLAAAHAHGILHRDLKPANIYLHKTPTGGLQPKILDFGISKILGSELTQSGVVLGTPSYMSPEQARGVPDLDPRMDVWSLGVILYECLAGRLPFTSREYRTLVEEILDKKHTPIEQLAADVPDDLARAIDEALEKSRERRLASAAAMAQKLTAILRARGHTEMLREPEDEFSDGAPTLAQDRDFDFDKKPPIDDTVGDAANMKAVQANAKPTAPTAPANANTNAKMPKAPTTAVAIKIEPAPTTSEIAARTSGNRRTDRFSLPRPAAGSPAKKSGESTPSSELTMPDGAKAATVPRTTTLGWETNVGKAASGREEKSTNKRDEMSTEEPRPVTAAQAASILSGSGLGGSGLGGSGLPRSSRMSVDDAWDTTVADVPQEDMEKGDAPEAAPAARPSQPAPSVAIAKPALALKPDTAPEVPKPNLRRSESPQKTGANANGTLGAIPGFTAPLAKKPSTTPPPPPKRVQTIPPHVGVTMSQSSSSAKRPSSRPPGRPPSVPPPRAALGAEPLAASPSKTRPPRPPPKTIPPGAHSNTLRPPNDRDGFAAAMPPRSTPPPRAPDANAPLIAPELFALDRPQSVMDAFAAPPPPPSFDPSSATPAPSSDNRASIPAVGPRENGLEDTDRRARGPMPILPFLAAAVAVLFVFGAVIGTVAAKSRSVDHKVRRFATAQMVIIAWTDGAVRVAEQDQSAADEQAKSEAARLAAEQSAAAIAPSASVVAAPSASIAPTADVAATATPPPVPTSKPKWTPPPNGKTTTAKPKPKPKAPTKTPAPSDDDDKPKKKKQGKEWWEKKF